MSSADNRSASSKPLTVLFSFGPSAPDANPYVDLLAESVAESVKVEFFSWRKALFGSYDIFHIHWPEALVRRKTVMRSTISQALVVLLICKLAIFRIPIVRTEHNLHPHEKGSAAEGRILNLLDARTDSWIIMNRASPRRSLPKTSLILHGHYRDRYTNDLKVTQVPGQLLNFGIIRPYKGVEELVSAFTAIPPDCGTSLVVMGKPITPEIGLELTKIAGNASNISLDLRHVPDNELSRAIIQSELVVLPYQAMHNSGVLLLALSLGTPVFVPKNRITDDLAEEVGEQWVQRFSGKLSPEEIIAAREAVHAIQGTPNLEARGWESLGRQHFEAYKRAAKMSS
ncbi:glycosyl transferase [Pseudarthrobacter enclensis]|uniref:glycosyl transferase n=1 Tax=Pseudarthrobacter enclensis TaxID=993070 RepID=UPI0036C0FA62